MTISLNRWFSRGVDSQQSPDCEIAAARQKLVKRNWRFSLVPWLVFTILLLMLGWEVLRLNMDFYDWPWSISLMGIAPTATLAGIFGSLLIARGQFARSMRPGLAWSSGFDRSAALAGSAWVVRLMNFGPGPANIEVISYSLKIRESPGFTEREGISHRDLVGLLKNSGLNEGSDYSLHLITPGAFLPVVKQTSEGIEFAALKSNVIERLEKLNFRVRVADIMGDHHEKSLPFIATLPDGWREVERDDGEGMDNKQGELKCQPNQCLLEKLKTASKKSG